MGVNAQMLVVTREKQTPAQVRKMAYDICEAFGSDSFWVWEDYENDNGTTGRHALEIIEHYAQDGPAMQPAKGEQYIQVHPATRYYGKGYERGNLPKLIAIAEWLEHRLPGCAVWYGGDSSGICAEPFGKVERDTLWQHFCTVGHRPYSGAFASFIDGSLHPPLCGFCDHAMTSCGGGGVRVYYYCAGCGKKVIRSATGKVIIVEKDKDFFTAIQESQ